MPTFRAPRTSAYAVSALCAVALLGGCGSEGSGGGSGVGSSSMPSSSGTPSSPSGSPSASTSPAMPPSGRARPTTMTGQVTSTEGGCVVFKSDRDARQWVLVGETKGLVAGTAYVIDGVAMDAMAERGLSVLPSCEYVQSWLTKHPDHLGVVPADQRAAFGLPPA